MELKKKKNEDLVMISLYAPSFISVKTNNKSELFQILTIIIIKSQHLKMSTGNNGIGAR